MLPSRTHPRESSTIHASILAEKWNSKSFQEFSIADTHWQNTPAPHSPSILILLEGLCLRSFWSKECRLLVHVLKPHVTGQLSIIVGLVGILAVPVWHCKVLPPFLPVLMPLSRVNYVGKMLNYGVTYLMSPIRTSQFRSWGSILTYPIYAKDGWLRKKLAGHICLRSWPLGTLRPGVAPIVGRPWFWSVILDSHLDSEEETIIRSKGSPKMKNYWKAHPESLNFTSAADANRGHQIEPIVHHIYRTITSIKSFLYHLSNLNLLRDSHEGKYRCWYLSPTQVLWWILSNESKLAQ